MIKYWTHTHTHIKLLYFSNKSTKNLFKNGNLILIGTIQRKLGPERT
jgi:hypothetical protein